MAADSDGFSVASESDTWWSIASGPAPGSCDSDPLSAACGSGGFHSRHSQPRSFMATLTVFRFSARGAGPTAGAPP